MSNFSFQKDKWWWMNKFIKYEHNEDIYRLFTVNSKVKLQSKCDTYMWQVNSQLMLQSMARPLCRELKTYSITVCSTLVLNYVKFTDRC